MVGAVDLDGTEIIDKEKMMSAPSKAVLNKLDNPAHAKVSRRHGIDLHG